MPTPPALGDEPPIVRYPIIEQATRNLATRRVMDSISFAGLAQEAKVKAFTIAHVSSQDALEKVRDVLASDVAVGGTLAQFREAVDDALGASALSPMHVENIYRTNVATAYSEGQKSVIGHWLVQSQFPYAAYHAVHDERARREHRAMESHGIQGTNIYRMDDPTLQKFWPPWAWMCRCEIVPLSVADAARAGIVEAQQWLETGIPPKPVWVTPPPFDLPPGWRKAA